MSRTHLLAVVFLAVLVADAATVVAQPPAAPSPPTIWSFLGIPQGVRKVQGALQNRRGNFPRLEQKPPLKALAAPENLESPVQAIKKAAEVKVAEDLAPQKIKAIKYLASIGCGCYDIDDSITAALVEATKDCTETVRLQTLESIAEAATGKCCSQCGLKCCCKEDMLKRLAAMAYERDEHGCYLEPSERVRAAAVTALCACCPSSEPVTVLEEEEEPAEPPVVPEPEQPQPGVPMPEQPSEDTVQIRGQEGVTQRGTIPSASRTEQAIQLLRTPSDRIEGIAVAVDNGVGRAHVHFADGEQMVEVGTVLTIYPAAGTNYESLGTAEVVQAFPGSAHVAVTAGTSPAALARGSILTKDPGTIAPMPRPVSLSRTVRR